MYGLKKTFKAPLSRRGSSSLVEFYLVICRGKELKEPVGSLKEWSMKGRISGRKMVKWKKNEFEKRT